MSRENFMGTKQLTDNYKRNTPEQSEETATKKVIDTYSPKGNGWDGDEYELVDDKSYQSIIKTKQGGKSLKNKHGGYPSMSTGSPNHIKRKWVELKKHYNDPNVSSGGYHMRKTKKESIDEQFEDLEINEAVKKTETISTKIQNALNQKSRMFNLPGDILEEVYRRGVADYNTRMIITEDQWAFGRVNNFIAGGKTCVAEDADLWNEISKRSR
jgi:hypothetical protein